MESNEQKAWAVGNNKARLLKRLLEARSMLVKQYRQEFKTYTLDVEHRRMISTTGAYILQWQVRNHPDMPISYENQQTSQGDVYLLRVQKKL
jgi:hypothetical protein